MTTSLVLDGLVFPEGPRWRDGRLWVSDMHDQRVLTVEPSGRSETVCKVAGQPSGLGWLPDGRMLLVSMTDRRVLRMEPEGLVVHAELAQMAPCHCNDMVVDAQGRAWVGNFGAELGAGSPPPTVLIRVDPDGSASIAADGLHFPNGSVITPDGRTLIVGETFASRLTAFDITPDGRLENRRIWAALENVSPDGCCLDAEGAIWVASPTSREVLRVREGGEVLERIPTEQRAIACMLGGTDRRTLYVLTAPSIDPRQCREQRSARILARQVDVPGDGLP